ncbi:MAG: condensation domain-containing protein, partial [Methylococcales bacterium]
MSDLSREQSLESDLGLDSIKTIELMNAIVPHLPAHLRDRFQQSLVSGNLFTVQSLGELEDCIAQLDPHYHDAGPIETDLSMAGGDSLTTQVFAIVAGVTGHHVEELTAELFLESDLGLDSIKTVELMNALSQVIPAQHQSEFMEKLSNGALFAVQTLGELLVLMASDSEAAVHVPATLATAEQGVQASATHTVDIVDAQYPFLVAHSAISPCSLSSGLRLQGPFSTEYARLAWDGLLSRHPMLRARLVIPDDALSFKDYSLEVLDAVTAPALEVKDLRALDSAAQEAFLAEAINRFLNQEWSLQLWPVHGFSVFRLADDIHEVVFANHHVFADGLSNQQIMREFITLYAAIATGQPAELAPTTTVADYQQMVARINAWSDTDADKALEQFLRRQGKSRFFWDPEHKGITKHSRADSRSYRFAASAKSTSILLQAAGRWRLPVNTLLVGAYLRAISRFAGDQQQLVLNIPTSGRLYPEVDATQTIGCFAQNLALTLPLPATELSWREYLPRVHENIEEALAHGYDRA